MKNVIEVCGKERINSRARHLLKQSLLPEVIAIVERLDYRLFVHDSIQQALLPSVLTIILTSHGNNVNYFRQAIDSVLKQTAKNFELILVDHGCEPELRTLIHEYFIADTRIKLLAFGENRYDPEPSSFFDNRFSHVLNAALFCSDGEYIYFLSYDDFLSANYIGNMVQLFEENSNCVAATPSVVSVNETSELNTAMTERLRQCNIRDRYVKGIDLATSVLYDQKQFGPPGGLCCYRTDVVLGNGGLDQLNDLSQIFKFSVLGEVGTSTEAVLYWRHHPNQTNKLNRRTGALGYSLQSSWLHHIEEFYSVKRVPQAYRNAFAKQIKKKIHEGCLCSIRDSISTGPKGSLSILSAILNTAPKIYLAYFAMFLVINLSRRAYTLLPERVKVCYRRAKSFMLLRAGNS